MIFDHPSIRSLEKLPHNQRFSLVAMAIITLSVPLGIWSLGMSTSNSAKANSPSPNASTTSICGNGTCDPGDYIPCPTGAQCIWAGPCPEECSQDTPAPRPVTLPHATQYRHYSTQFTYPSSASLRLTGLPTGLTSICNPAPGTTEQICHLNGTPQSYGNFPVSLMRGQETVTTFQFTVNRSMKYWYLPRWLTNVFSLE